MNKFGLFFVRNSVLMSAQIEFCSACAQYNVKLQAANEEIVKLQKIIDALRAENKQLMTTISVDYSTVSTSECIDDVTALEELPEVIQPMLSTSASTDSQSNKIIDKCKKQYFSYFYLLQFITLFIHRLQMWRM